MKYYHEQENEIHKFYTVKEYDTELIEFDGEIIKYRFVDVYVPEELPEIKWWEYNKLINSVIFKK